MGEGHTRVNLMTAENVSEFLYGLETGKELQEMEADDERQVHKFGSQNNRCIKVVQ